MSQIIEMYATENHTMCKTFYMRAIGHLSISNLNVYFVENRESRSSLSSNLAGSALAEEHDYSRPPSCHYGFTRFTRLSTLYFVSVHCLNIELFCFVLILPIA